MKRMSVGLREENYEHVLMCLICRSLFDDSSHQPKFLPCHHTFCKECLREYVQQIGDDIECPSCRKIATIPAAGVAALQTNFYVKYIQSLVQGSWVPENSGLECTHHTGKKVSFYCQDCSRSVCQDCCSTCTPIDEGGGGSSGEADDSKTKYNGCGDHLKVPITMVTEEYHQKLDTSFSRANATIEKKKDELEAMLNALSKEKDDSLLLIESKFEAHVHALSRRATLLKNKVIDIYKGQVEKLEHGIDQVSWAMTAIVSLKEYHEKDIARGYFQEVQNGIFELEEVSKSISDRVNPTENHIVFDQKHGVEKFTASVRDLGRVQYSKPRIPRTEPEGSVLMTPAEDTAPQDCASNSQVPATISDFGAVGVESTPEIGAVGGGGEASSYQPLESKPERKRQPADPIIPDTNGNGDVSTAATNTTDPNSNPVTTTGAVRPKFLSSELKKNTTNSVCRPKTKAASSMSSSTTTAATKAPASNIPYVVEPGEALPGRLGVAPMLHLSDINLNQDDPAHKPHTDKISLKTEKDKLYTYHHLVYTSYDEEELLKELRRGGGGNVEQLET